MLSVDSLYSGFKSTVYENGSQTNEDESAEKQFSQLKTLNGFIIGNATNVSVMENETLEQQANGQHNDFEKFVDSASGKQVIENILTTN